MGRRPIPVERRLPRLTRRQSDMLQVTWHHGVAFRFVRSADRSVWQVRTGAPGTASVPRSFAMATGDRLVDLRYFLRDPDGDVIGSEGLIARCYVVSAAGVGRVTQRGNK